MRRFYGVVLVSVINNKKHVCKTYRICSETSDTKTMMFSRVI